MRIACKRDKFIHGALPFRRTEEEIASALPSHMATAAVPAGKEQEVRLIHPCSCHLVIVQLRILFVGLVPGAIRDDDEVVDARVGSAVDLLLNVGAVFLVLI